MADKNRALWRFLLVIYWIIMLWLLFGRSSDWTETLPYTQLLSQNINLTPFLTIRNYLHVLRFSTDAALIRHCFINLAGNVLLFIPLGILLPCSFLKMRRFPWFFLTCAVGIGLVEGLQLLTLLGSLDVDDLILNLTGALIGFLLHLPAQRQKKGGCL